ncbi:squalene synthetase-like protein [Coemansia interrupta]|uniref:Squalene synthetase-like protein n=1 Tax=Coemansia interrupta TaxID=1126814 RepID=A0A9W8HDU9_9FUNG|nr:squalene synthetase-like protein [Coemansia interrupta]
MASSSIASSACEKRLNEAYEVVTGIDRLVEKAYDAHSSIYKTFGDLAGVSSIRKDKSVTEAAHTDITNSLEAMRSMLATISNLQAELHRLEKKPREKLISDEVRTLLDEYSPYVRLLTEQGNVKETGEMIDSSVRDLDMSAMRLQIGDFGEGLTESELEQQIGILREKHPQLDFGKYAVSKRTRLLVVRIPTIIQMSMNLKQVEGSDGEEFEVNSINVFSDDENGPFSRFQVFNRIAHDSNIIWFSIAGFSVEHRLAKIVQWFDTQGSTNVKVTTTTAEHAALVVESSTPEQRQKGKKQFKKQIQVITDDVVTASESTAPAIRSSNGSAARGLDQQFIDLSLKKSNKKGKSKGKAKGKKSKRNGSQGYSANDPPPSHPYKEELDTSLADYMENVGAEELADMVKRSNASRHLMRDLGDDFDSVSLSTDGFEHDDPFKYDDDIVDMVLDRSAYGDSGSSDEEGAIDEGDGCPVDLDMARVSRLSHTNASRGGNSQNRKPPKHGGPTQGAQNIEKFKYLDRSKSRNNSVRRQAAREDRPSPGFDPRLIINRLDMLVRSDDLSSLYLQPMNKFERQIVHILAREYRINSKSQGSGDRRMPVLSKTPRSCAPTQQRRIKRLLLLFDEGGLMPEHWLGPQENASKGLSQGGKHNGKGKQKSKQNGSGSNPGRMDGKMVGHQAPIVGETNVGHKMLKQMGWQPGQGLGANEEGRSTPVDVMFRAGRRGLGS